MLHLDDEELLADESFINYCLGRNEADVRKWNTIILDNPADAIRLDELRAIVLLTSRGIQNIALKNQIAELGRRIDLSEEEAVATTGSVYKRRSTWWTLMAAAACMVLIIGTTIFYRLQNRTAPVASPFSYITKLAEKKSLILPDGSKVILNAGSKLTVDAGFGKQDRKLQLDGEAFFDVVHDSSKPFVVQTSRMDVKVLGTAFNVKAYETDGTSEASLIRGSVELSLKNEHRKVTLSPNEKYLLRADKTHGNIPAEVAPAAHEPASGLLPVRINKEDTAIVEVSWTQDKLVFVDEPFEELVKQLERWYGVKIEIADPLLKKIQLTASFRNEGIDDVLAALSFSKPFNFERKNDVIMIYK
ncbi:MAG: DUF4974 domain-containing protein [Agriterribacter sp.]